MKLYICEKPSVAKTLAGVLGQYSKKEGYYQGGGWGVTWAFGHFFELAEPSHYEEDWKEWNLNSLPMFPESFQTVLKNDIGVNKQFRVIETLLQQASIVINCGDAGQEGELIMRWIFDHVSFQAPVKRLWISSLTPAAIQKGLADLRPAEEFDSLYLAGKARAESDWLIGLNSTRAFTKRFSAGGKGNVLTIGRVQTPTLNIVVQRDLEIENFKPSPFWTLTTEFGGSIFTHSTKKFTEQPAVQEILDKVTGQPFQVTSVEQQVTTSTPPLPFDLTSAQSVANKIYDLSSDDTLSLIQDLYEWQLLTYPRVDNRYLPEDMFSEMESTIAGVIRGIKGVEPEEINIKKNRIFNDSKITDHHAIIPTGKPISGLPSGQITANHKKIYELITRQLIAQFYPDCKLAVTKVRGESAGEEFHVKGTVIKQAGWQTVALSGKKAKEKTIPEFNEGQQGDHNPSVQQKKTSPPKPFTEGTLLKAMENAGRYIDEDELAEAIKENGIGRPSTRAAIIEGLFKKKFIVRKGKAIVSTERGRGLISVIQNDVITKPELTAKWEKALRGIEAGQFPYDKFIANAKKLTAMLVSEAKEASLAQKIVTDDTLTNIQCPGCGQKIKVTPKTFQCSNQQECNFVVYRKIGNSKVSVKAFAEVLQEGKTKKPRTFQSKKGKGFKAHLTFKKKNPGQDMIFFDLIFEKAEELGRGCPRPGCGQPLKLNKKAVFCSNKSCGFVLFRTFAENEIPIENLHELINKGKTLCTGFKNKKGRYNVLLSPKKEGPGYKAEFKN